MAVDPKFTTASPFVASYDWTEFTDATGIKTFYGADTVDNAATSYVQTSQTPYSTDVLTAAGATDQTPQKILDLDFDVVLNIPQDIKGKFMAQVPYIMGHETTANMSCTGYIVVKLRKWDGSSETEIASNTKTTVRTIANLQAEAFTEFVEIDVATASHIAAGETIRVTVELWIDGTSTNPPRGAIMHDPADRLMAQADDYGYNGGAAALTTAPLTSQLKFFIPFRINT